MAKEMIPEEVKEYAVKERKSGKTLEAVKALLKAKGYNVSLQSISIWTNYGISKDETVERKSEYELVMEKQNKQIRIFRAVQVGCKIKIEVEAMKREKGNKPSIVKIEKAVRVIGKYKYYLLCWDGKNKLCVDRMQIIGIYRNTQKSKIAV